MKFFSVNRNHVAVMITLFFVILFGAIYFFIYIPNNEKSVEEQRFRTLQHVDRNIKANLWNSKAMLNNLLGAYYKRDAQSEKIVQDYIRSFPKDNFSLFAPEGPLNIKPDSLVDTGIVVSVNNANKEIQLVVNRAFGAGNTEVFRMRMRFTFEQFMKYLLPDNIFDHYIVFSNGQVAYETFPSGVSYIKDSLLVRRNGIISSTVRNLTVGGTDYKLFLQPVNLTPETEWIVGGLLSNKHYQQERNRAPSSVVLLLTTIMLVIIVAFPWLKLYQMGSKDRLTVADGVWTTIVSMLLMSLLFFSYFKYNTLLRKDLKSSKDPLAVQMVTAFEDELDTALNTLYGIDASVALQPGLLKDSTRLGTIRDSTTGIYKTAGDTTTGLSINQVFWLKENGAESANWIADTIRAPHGNFRNRGYYKNIVGRHFYLLHGDTSRRFYLDQVISWNTGMFTSVLAIPSKVPGQAVAAISFNIRSLRTPVLPEGYHFAIIDDAAKVLYHSNVRRNLKENLIEEFSERKRLHSVMEARTEDEFRTRYFGKDYNVAVRPIGGLPYYMVMFGDIGYRDTRDMQIFSFTFSMMLLFFTFLVVQLLVVFLASSKNSFFKKQLYDTSWVGPKMSSHKQYTLTLVFHLLVIALAIFFLYTSTFLTYLFILLFSVTVIGLFINSLFSKKYATLGNLENKKFKRGSLAALACFLAVTDGFAYATLETSNFGILLLYELIVLALAAVLLMKGYSVLHRSKKTLPQSLTSKWNYTHSFTLMILTRLILTSGIPVAFFYISSYNFEQNINIRYRHLQYANGLKEKLGDRVLQATHSNGSFARGYYADGAWIKEIGVGEKGAPVGFSEEEDITTSILQLFHIHFTDEAIAEDKFYNPAAADSSFFYNALLRGACRTDSVTKTYVSTGIPGRYLTIGAAPLNYRSPTITDIYGWLFYIPLILGLIAFYFILYNIISKIFCFSLPDLSLWKALDERILSNTAVNRLVFIIGLPGSGKLSRIKEKIKNGEIQGDEEPLVYDEGNPEKSNVFIADLIHIPDSGDIGNDNAEWMAFMSEVFNKKNRLVVVNHFEYNIQDAATNRIKLNFLEDLMLDNHCQIIILSTIHPVAFLDSVMDPASMPSDKSIPGQDLERWHVLLGHFRIILFPMEQSPAVGVDYSYRTIYRETQQTHFLGKLQECVLDVAKTIPEGERRAKGDELAFKLQVTSHYFYMYIWQSLTKEEKFLLYDLAEDNLVNSYDDYNLNMLIAKGIIIRPDGILRLFNKGFRNFILTAIGNAEAMKIKNHIKDNGNWNQLKTPLLIVLLAILSFLLASQEEAYSKLITYVAALGAGVPTVLKLFSIFDKGGQKSGDGK